LIISGISPTVCIRSSVWNSNLNIPVFCTNTVGLYGQYVYGKGLLLAMWAQATIRIQDSVSLTRIHVPCSSSHVQDSMSPVHRNEVIKN
jgi:hypothetical protein